MGMSTFVDAIRPADDQWHRMKAVWDTCKAAGVEPTREVSDFFDGNTPDAAGVVISLYGNPAVREWTGVHQEGLEVTLADLPPNVSVLRFYNSW